MARDDHVIPLDELLDEKIKEFESGEEKVHDRDLDKLIWELNDLGNEEPPQDAQEFKAEAPIEEELVEKTMLHTDRGRIYLKEPEIVGDRKPSDVKSLRVEIEGVDCEIVCGSISAAKKKKIDAYCRENEVTASDIWYDDKTMPAIMGKTWRGWAKVDQLFHEMGLGNGKLHTIQMKVSWDGEPMEEADPNLGVKRYEPVPKPKPRKGCVAVTAGILNKAKYIFDLDIAGDFEVKKLTLNYKDLKNIGVNGFVLAEIRYGNRVMNYHHEDYGDEDALDVIFLS